MNLSFSNSTIKYIMFVFNFLFVITGIILISVGATISSNYSTYDTLLDDKYFSLPGLLIATGVIIFLISFLGCYGAFRENWFFLMIFSALLAIIFIFEFSAGIAGYVLRDKTSDFLESEFSRTMQLYNRTPSVQIMWDSIQRNFECCGVQSKQDWSSTFKNKSLPLTCCPGTDGIVGVFYCNAAEPTKTTTQTTEASTTKPAPLRETTVESTSEEPTTISTTHEITTSTPNTSASTTTQDPDTTPTVSATTTTESESTTEGKQTEGPATTTTESGTTTPESVSTTEGKQTEAPYPQSSTAPYSVGCEAAFGDWVKAHAVDIGAVGFALAIIQLFGVGFSFHLARLLRNGNYSST